MKKYILFCFLLIGFITANANDTSSVKSLKNPRFRIGVSACILSMNYWTNTGGLMIIGSSGSDTKPSHFSASYLTPYGLTLGYRLFNNFYFQTGCLFTKQFIDKKLSDALPQPKGGSAQTIFYSYESNYFQIPLSIAYTSKRAVSPYACIGIKNNFIYNEHLYGKHILSTAYDSVGNSIVTSENTDISDNRIRYKTISPFINFGLATFTKNRKFGFMFYFACDLPPIYTIESTIRNYSFSEFSIPNYQIVYNF